MRRPLLAAAFAIAAALAFTRARADEGAYGSLVGLAKTAAADSGPDAGADRAAPAARARPSRAAAPRREEAEGAVTAPPPSAPRFWTRLYSALTPSWHAVPSLASGFDAPAVSTSAARPASPAVASPLSRLAAANAGERRGLTELISSFPAPDDAQ